MCMITLTISPAAEMLNSKQSRKHHRLRLLGYVWPIEELQQERFSVEALNVGGDFKPDMQKVKLKYIYKINKNIYLTKPKP